MALFEAEFIIIFSFSAAVPFLIKKWKHWANSSAQQIKIMIKISFVAEGCFVYVQSFETDGRKRKREYVGTPNIAIAIGLQSWLWRTEQKEKEKKKNEIIIHNDDDDDNNNELNTRNRQRQL